jgi:MacB-like periplasmic core domain
VLGIVVGISALVTMVALIEGARDYISERLVTLQPDVFQVSQVPASPLNVNAVIKVCATGGRPLERPGLRRCTGRGAFARSPVIETSVMPQCADGL